MVKVGGRGHILGDQGSASDIALQALRAVVYQHDVNGRFPALGEAILQALLLNHPDDLIPWTQEAEKQEIARLAITVFTEAGRGDDLATQLVHDAAQKLADMAADARTIWCMLTPRCNTSWRGARFSNSPVFLVKCPAAVYSSTPIKHSSPGPRKRVGGGGTGPITGSLVADRAVTSSARRCAVD